LPLCPPPAPVPPREVSHPPVKDISPVSSRSHDPDFAKPVPKTESFFLQSKEERMKKLKKNLHVDDIVPSKN
jgi:hypothetical protein